MRLFVFASGMWAMLAVVYLIGWRGESQWWALFFAANALFYLGLASRNRGSGK